MPGYDREIREELEKPVGGGREEREERETKTEKQRCDEGESGRGETAFELLGENNEKKRSERGTCV